MAYDTILVNEQAKVMTITLNRLADENSVNVRLLEEVNLALDRAESRPEIRIVVLAGCAGTFSNGMDLSELSRSDHLAAESITEAATLYFRTLRRFTSTGKLIISNVDGRANAAGVGLVAASDFVVISRRTTFTLSEALFGLVPANVVPFLIRRVGFQRAYLMTLTAQQIDAGRALEIGLADEITSDPEAAVRRLLVRVHRIREATVRTTKGYFRQMFSLNEDTERLAVAQICELLQDVENVAGIRRYVAQGIFPWQAGQGSL
jgi:polyketide biosynthesis enoyl-CoA hydratase PksH